MAAPIACSRSVFASKQIRAHYVDLRNTTKLHAALAGKPKAVWIESPTNPLMNLVDIRAVSDLAHEHGALVICDNTFLSPYFQRPLELGADIVSHSTTKYINGHSDVVGGALVVKDAALAEKIGFLQNAMGTCAGPQDCFLVLRGVKTLALRMEEHNRNALAIAHWLEKHPKVSAVLHPGLESHPQHELALRQTSGIRRDIFLPPARRGSGGESPSGQLPALHSGGVAGRSGIADRAPHHHDPCLRAARGAVEDGNHAGPDSHFRRP